MTVALVMGAGGGTPPGLALLATPQPLPLTVLPGTVAWNQAGTAVSFLVTRGSSFESQTAPSLCLLDLRQAGERASVTATPLRYLGEVSGGRLWEQATSPNPPGGEKVYPLAYGQSRFNPFAWAGQNSPTDNRGVYGASAPAWAQDNSKPFDTLFPLLTNSGPTALPIPLLDLGQPDGSASRKSPGRDSSDKLRQDSFPYFNQDNSLFYLSGQVASRDNGPFLSGAAGLQLQIKELAGFARSDSPVEIAKGLSVKVLNQTHDPIRLPLLDKVTAPRFEAEWRPDGRGLLVAVPGSQPGQGGDFWLVDWPG